MKENELILCVVHNGKLHQAMLSDEECSLLESALSGIMPDKTIKVSSTPICDVEIYRGGKKVTTDDT